MGKMFYGYADVFLILAVFLGVNICSYIYQTPITLNEGKGWDGLIYYDMADQFTHQKWPTAQAPYVFRIGPTFIPSVIDSANLIRGFFLSNLIANTICVFLVIIWLRLYFADWKIRVVCASLFLFLWMAPNRFSYFYPTYIDPWVYVFIFFGMILLHQICVKLTILKIALFSVSIFFGVMFKENVILLPLSLFFIRNPLPSLSTTNNTFSSLKNFFNYWYLIPLMAALLGMVFVHTKVQATNQFNFFLMGETWARSRSILEFIYAWYIVYGPILAICLYSWKTIWGFLWTHQHLLVFLLGTILLAWCGGTDIERFLLMGAPVIYLLIGVAIQENLKLLSYLPLLSLLLVTQCISERIFWTLPDVPNEFKTPILFLNPLTSHFQYLDLYAHFQTHHFFIGLLECLLLTVFILFLLYYRQKSFNFINQQFRK